MRDKLAGRSTPRNHLSSRPGFLSLIAVSLMGLLLGCGTAPTGQSFVANTAALSVTPSALDFGAASPTSGPVVRIITVRNNGFVPIEVQHVSVAPAAFSVSGWKGAALLSPRQAMQVAVAFMPEATVAYSGVLTITGLSRHATQISGQQRSSVPTPGDTVLRGQQITTAVPLSGNAYSSSADNGHPNISVSISPLSATVQAGQSQQFSASVSGSGDHAVTWSAALGTISAAGLYVAPTVSSPIIDTVSATSVADPTVYTSAEVSVQTATGAAVYTITNQEPVTDVHYAGSFIAKRLPNAGYGGPTNHLMANSAIAVHDMLTQAMNGGTLNQIGGVSYVATPGANEGGATALYYASDSDPVYQITNCGNLPFDGLKFHAPSGAQFGSNTNGASCPANTCYDSKLEIWDQSADQRNQSGGDTAIFGFYDGGISNPQLPACSSHDWNHPCLFTPNNNYCSYDRRSTGKAYGAGDAYATNSMAPAAGTVRMQEWLQGTIHHAIYLDEGCNGSASGAYPSNRVFPATEMGGFTAAVCTNSGFSTHPPNGSLIFFDYTDSDLAYLKSVLPAWQYPIIAAMTYYGGYIGDTGSAGGLYVGRPESGQPYLYYSQHGNPSAWSLAQKFYNWLSSACTGGSCWTGSHDPSQGYSATVYALAFFDGIPVVRGGSVFDHMHVADPCVAKAQAGLSVSQGACY